MVKSNDTKSSRAQEKPRSKARRATRSEASLVRGFCSRLDDFIGGRGRGPWGLKREVAVGRSVADVVIFLDLPEESRRRTPLGTAECVFLARLRRGDGLPTVRSDSRAATVLDQLCARDLVTLTEDGGAHLASTVNHAGDVIAVEAKLRRWREALEQAIEYKRFADFSYVVLPAELARAAVKNVTHFEDAGVGLLVLGIDAIEEIIPAAKHQDHDWRREFVCSRLDGVRWSD